MVGIDDLKLRLEPDVPQLSTAILLEHTRMRTERSYVI